MTEHESETVVMPRELTSENGAKFALIGEFSVLYEIPPHPDYSGEMDYWAVVDVPVPWTTIKEIYARCVALFGHEEIK